MNSTPQNWSEYFRLTRNNPPSKLLIKALNYVKNKRKAIDLGAGALKDSRFLLQQGFYVTAIDSSDLFVREAKLIKPDKFQYFVSSFADFHFPKNEYDLATAMYSLPFNPPESFETVISKIKQSLAPDGIFCGQLFGINDDWHTNQKMTFHTKEKATKLFSDMEIILLEEDESDGKTANGNPKHWHVFHFIVKN